ncbi:MAG: Coq4 family protein [Myxococcota bacterium]|nr:Coq4 family protein [Myxococcota bacterium]
MTTAPATIHVDIDPRARRHRPQWRRAFAALRQLLRDAERTYLAYEITLALDGGTGAGILERMLAHREGRRLLREQPSLLDALTDRAALEAMPDESFGRAYLDHLDRYGLRVDKLVELGREAGGDFESEDPDIRWASQRGNLCHDLWHVLTGYGADPVGEATLLAFSWAQTGSRTNALLTLGATARTVSQYGPSWLPYVWKAFRRGRSAVCLAALPYERLLPLPLDDVRAVAGIEPPEVAHPKGVWSGTQY